jgi:predicted homoserine dehydrogenase-like protein
LEFVIYEHLFRRSEKQSARAALIGTGSYGVSLLAQAQATPRLDIPVVCDRDLEAGRSALLSAGVPAERIRECQGREEALRAVENGKTALIADGAVAAQLGMDVVIECTGDAGAGALHADLALQAGSHVALVSKEADSVVGPLLAVRAQDLGLVCTPVDGDQHGLLAGLFLWARTLGFRVLAGGKARESDFIYSDVDGTVRDRRTTLELSAQGRKVLARIRGGDEIALRVEERAHALQGLPLLMTADLCEMTIAANHTGLLPDRPELWTPVLRTTEVPQVLSPRGYGGVLGREGAIDMFTCLRRQDEAGQMGGEFIVVACENASVRDFLDRKDLIMNEGGTAALIYRPLHLLGAETPVSVLCAALLNVPTGGEEVRPRVDLNGRARLDIPAGTVLDRDVIHDGELLEPLINDASPLGPGKPLPLYMAEGLPLTTDVPSGSLLCCEHVPEPADSPLWRLRREQDRRFLG